MTEPSTGSGVLPLDGFFLGRRDYAPMHQLMRDLFEARRENRVGDTVLLLEHSPVVTFGRGAKAENLLANAETLTMLGISVEETGRGGDVTLHAPGQLVAYPIINLAPQRCDVRKYVQGLTRVMRSIARSYGIDGGTICALIGLWVDNEAPTSWPGEDAAKMPAKIGAIGVRISRWIDLIPLRHARLSTRIAHPPHVCRFLSFQCNPQQRRRTVPDSGAQETARRRRRLRQTCRTIFRLSFARKRRRSWPVWPRSNGACFRKLSLRYGSWASE